MEEQRINPTGTGHDDETRERVRRIIEGGEQAKDTAAERVAHTADSAEAQVQRIAAQVRSAAHDAQQTSVDDVQAETEANAEEFKRRLNNRADETMTMGGRRLQQVANDLRANASEGKPAVVAERAADLLERGGRYLEEASPDEVRSDLERNVRAHPLKALAIAGGVGFVVARLTAPRRSHSRRS